MLNRLILWLSLAGMILALHLWVQKSRGFDQGCLGLGKPIPVALGGDCQAASELPASHLFGVSNAAWGYAFYFALSLVSFAKIFAAGEWARRLHRFGEGSVIVAAGYSAYLVYVMVAAGAICVLCLSSAALVMALLGLHGLIRRQGGFTPIAEEVRLREIGFAGIGGFAAAGLLVGVLMFVNRIGTRPIEGSSKVEFDRAVGRALPQYIDSEKLAEMRACHFDWSEPPLDFEKLLSAETPFIGAPELVPVMVFLDPNCPHCAEYFPHYLQLAEKFKDRVRFTVLPRVLWAQSIPEVAALKLAEGSGKYFELWRILLARQPGPRKGMTTEQIAGIFRELGLDASNLEQRLAAARPAVLAMQKRAAASGIDSAPSIYFATRKVWMQNRSDECMAVLIDRVASGLARVR